MVTFSQRIDALPTVIKIHIHWILTGQHHQLPRHINTTEANPWPFFKDIPNHPFSRALTLCRQKLSEVPSGWRWGRKWLALTYPCPKGRHNPIRSRLEVFRVLRRIPYHMEWIHVAMEPHKNGEDHYHVSIKFKNVIRSRNRQLCDVAGVSPDIAKSLSKDKKGKKKPQGLQMHDWLNYLMKSDTGMFSKGQNPIIYLDRWNSRGATSVARVCDSIYEHGQTLHDIIRDQNLRSVAFLHGPKIAAFANEVKIMQHRHIVPTKISLSDLNKAETKCAKWWNFRCVSRRFMKKFAGLYLWSYEVSMQKSSFLKCVARVMNGSTTDVWCQTDKGWQDNFKGTERCLCIDALQGSFVSPALLEDLGSNQQVTIKGRHKTTNNRFKGPFIITSNKQLGELGYSQPDVLACRMCFVKPTEGLKKLINRFIAVHDLNPEEIFDEDSEMLFSDDEEEIPYAIGPNTPMDKINKAPEGYYDNWIIKPIRQ